MEIIPKIVFHQLIYFPQLIYFHKFRLVNNKIEYFKYFLNRNPSLLAKGNYIETIDLKTNERKWLEVLQNDNCMVFCKDETKPDSLIYVYYSNIHRVFNRMNLLSKII